MDSLDSSSLEDTTGFIKVHSIRLKRYRRIGRAKVKCFG